MSARQTDIGRGSEQVGLPVVRLGRRLACRANIMRLRSNLMQIGVPAVRPSPKLGSVPIDGVRRRAHNGEKRRWQPRVTPPALPVSSAEVL